MDSLSPWDCLQHNKQLSINHRKEETWEETGVQCAHVLLWSFVSGSTEGDQRQMVTTQAPGVEGQGGWGFQKRSPEWWRTLTSVRVHAAKEDTAQEGGVLLELNQELHKWKEQTQTASISKAYWFTQESIITFCYVFMEREIKQDVTTDYWALFCNISHVAMTAHFKNSDFPDLN